MILNNEKDLIKVIASQSGENQKVVGNVLKHYKEVISAWFKEQKERMEQGRETGRLVINKFCSFYVKHRKSFMGRNPITGLPSSRPETVKPKIKPSQKLGN